MTDKRYRSLLIQAAEEWDSSSRMEVLARIIAEAILKKDDLEGLSYDELDILARVPRIAEKDVQRLQAMMEAILAARTPEEVEADERAHRSWIYSILTGEHRWCLRCIAEGSITPAQDRAFGRVYPHLVNYGLIDETHKLTSLGEQIVAGILKRLSQHRLNHPDPLVRTGLWEKPTLTPERGSYAALFTRIARGMQHGYDPHMEMLVRYGLLDYTEVPGIRPSAPKRREFFIPEPILKAWRESVDKASLVF